jgi:ABC-type glutathione transport system ATPase component
VLIADEPTSALDARLRNQILELLVAQCEQRQMAMLLISHDLPLVAQHCHRVLVMYQGQKVDEMPASELPNAAHPYTRTLWTCRPQAQTYGQMLPTLDRSRILRSQTMAIAEIRHLEVSFGEKTVVRDASFTLEQGETFSLIGASGCGKSTLMRVLAGLQREWRGEMSLFGSKIKAGVRYQGTLRRNVQMVSGSLCFTASQPHAVSYSRRTVTDSPRESGRTAGQHSAGRGGAACGFGQALPASTLGWTASACGDRPGAAVATANSSA